MQIGKISGSFDYFSSLNFLVDSLPEADGQPLDLAVRFVRNWEKEK